MKIDKTMLIGEPVSYTHLLGTMMATAFPEENKFGYICSYQTQATYKYRYGYSEGVLSVNPDAEFMYNYTNSYADTTLAYELSLIHIFSRA